MAELRRPTEFMAHLIAAGESDAIARYYAHLENLDELTEATLAFARHPEVALAVLRQPGLEDHDIGRLSSHYHLHLLPQMREEGLLKDPEHFLEAIHQRLFAAVRNTPALARDTDHWLVHCRCLGEFCATTVELVRARDWYKQAAATAEARAGDASWAEPNVRVLVPLLEKLGEQHAALGEPTRALEQYALALSHRERLGERDTWPGLARIGDLYRALGRPTQALAYYQRLVTARTRRLEDSPAVTENALGLAAAMRTVGELFWAAGQVSQAMDAFEQAQSAAEGLYQQVSDDGACGRELVTCLWRLGDAAWALDHLAHAEQQYRRRVEVADTLARRDDSPSDDARLFLKGLNGLAELLKANGEYEQALSELSRALAVAQGLVERNPESFEDGRELCYSLMRLAEIRTALGRTTLTAECTQRAYLLWNRLAPQAERPLYVRVLETVYYDPAHFSQPAENGGEAQAYWRKCHETLRTMAHASKHLDDEAQKVLARMDHLVQSQTRPAESPVDGSGPPVGGMWSAGQGQLARLDPKLKESLVAGPPEETGGEDRSALTVASPELPSVLTHSDDIVYRYEGEGVDTEGAAESDWPMRLVRWAFFILFLALFWGCASGLWDSLLWFMRDRR
jgi:tetratricopeptide (TPR) repeat protein